MQQSVFELRNVSTRILRVAVILDQNYLVSRVTSLVCEAIEAAGEQIEAIVDGNYDRDLLWFRQFAFDPIEIGAPINGYMSRLLPPFQMLFKREAAGLKHFRLALNI